MKPWTKSALYGTYYPFECEHIQICVLVSTDFSIILDKMKTIIESLP